MTKLSCEDDLSKSLHQARLRTIEPISERAALRGETPFRAEPVFISEAEPECAGEKRPRL